MNALKISWLTGLAWLLLGCIAIALTNEYQVLVLGTVALTAIVGVGLNILMGLVGQTSLGHAAFYAIGAYVGTIASMKFGMPFPLAMLCAALISGLAGAALSLPALRVKGPYLAMVTIAFGYFVEQGIAEWKDVTGGWNGIMGIPQPSLFGLVLGSSGIACMAIVISALLIPAYAIFASSKWGVVMRATRGAEVAASAIGANLMLVRVIAFALSAALTGVAGCLFAVLNGFISPESFPFFQSIIFLLMVMIGGIGQAAGPLVGAVTVILLPEALSSLAEYRLMFFGGLLLIVLLIAPNGLTGALGAATQRYFKKFISPVQADQPLALAWFTSAKLSVLKLEKLGVLFGGNAALQGVTLQAHTGQITSLIGPNGAGKTTLLNLVTGFYQPTTGSVHLDQKELSSLPGYQVGRAGIARTYQTSQLFGDMSVLENVYFGLLQGRLLGHDLPAEPLKLCAALLNFAGYQGDGNARADSLAHVDRRLVEIARALATRPAMIMLDEPAAGLSAEEKSQLGIVLKNIAAQGVGVFIIEHDMALVMSISDRIHVLDQGKLIASGTPVEIQHDPRVRAAYLGNGESKFFSNITEQLNAVTPEHTDVLVVSHLCANYGAADVLNNIDLCLKKNQTACILGANGAGKSTLMRAISGLHKKFTGSIAFDGRDITDLPGHQIAALGLVMVPEGRQVFIELSVEDNIKIGAYARGGLSHEQLESLYAMFPKLKMIKTRRAGLLSGGEQQMLALARGLAASPVVLLLDEPSLGLAPAIVDELFVRLAALRQEGLTLLLVDQMADMALALSDSSNLLSAGNVVFQGTPEKLKEANLLELAYLG